MDISHNIKKDRLPKIQSKELRKGQQLKGPNEYTSIPVGRKKKETTREERGRGLGGKGDRRQGIGGHVMVLGGRKKLKP